MLTAFCIRMGSEPFPNIKRLIKQFNECEINEIELIQKELEILENEKQKYINEVKRIFGIKNEESYNDYIDEWRKKGYNLKYVEVTYNCYKNYIKYGTGLAYINKILKINET